MSKRFAAGLGTLACAITLALTGAPAGAASTLPTLNVALSGLKGVTVSGSMVSGAVSIVGTFSGAKPGHGNSPAFGIVRLDPGVTLLQAVAAVNARHGDLNALTPYGSLMVSAGAPSTVQTVLTPGSYVALNESGNGQPGFATFTVTQSASPAALPAASATQTAIEFGFKGPKVLHVGSMVRTINGGFLVHMDVLFGVPSAAVGHKAIRLLLAGKNRAAEKLSNNRFVTLMGPASPGAMQQQILKAKPGYYIQACFMNTLDGRDHTQLGMERLVRIVK